MDCDQVFAALTAAPFPTGAPSDRPIERHLASCKGCRRLAEALLPCEAGAPESLAAHERHQLPAYRPVRALAATGEGRMGSPFPGLPADSTRALYGPAMRSQVAAFTLTHQPLANPLRDAFLLAVVLAVVALGFWGVGMFVV